MKDRIQWVDCAKGIAVILVVLGHCVRAANSDTELVARAIIFSFHMPLFFLLSGLTTGYSKSVPEYFRKLLHSAYRLLVPAVLLYITITLIDFARTGTTDYREYFLMRLRILYYASGVKVKCPGGYVPALGMLWFLFSLFAAKALSDALRLVLRNETAIAAAVLVLTVSGVAVSRIKWLPWSFDVTLASLGFFWLGKRIKQLPFDRQLQRNTLIAFAVWAVTLAVSLLTKGTYLELAARKYPFFPLCFVTAAAGSLFVMLCSMILVSYKKAAEPLIWLGRHSMTLYCVHSMDYLLSSL